jgi:hypothetical protein
LTPHNPVVLWSVRLTFTSSRQHDGDSGALRSDAKSEREVFMFQFEFKGLQLTQDQLEADAEFQAASGSAMAIGFDPGNPEKVHVFASEADFISWSAGTPHAAAVTHAISGMSAQRQRGDAGRGQIESQYNEDSQRVQREMQNLSTQMGQPWPSEAVFRRGHELGIVHSLLLFDNYNYAVRDITHTRLLNIPGLPDFRWTRFDKQTSSLYISGVGALYSGYWYSGAVRWFGGFPFWGYPDLRQLSFDKMASCAWVTGP